MSETVSKMIKYIFGTLMMLVLAICFFGTGADYAYKKTFLLPNIVFALLGGVCILLIRLVAQGLAKVLEKRKHPQWIMLVLNFLFFVVLVALTYHYYFKTGWDARVVERAAKAISLNDWAGAQETYFSFYPNNIFITFLFSLVIRIGYLFGINNYYFSIILFQCFLFALTGFLLYCTATLWMNVRTGVSVWLLYLLVVGVSPWVVIPYSDATGVLFPTLLFYLYVRLCKGKGVELSVFLLTFCSYVGYRIKPQIAIVGIAVLIVTLASLGKGWLTDKKILIKRLVVAMAGLLAGVLLVMVGTKATHIELNDELVFGVPHFLMMGLNEEYGGVINIVDQDFSMSFDNVQDRTHGNLQVAQERIKDLGIIGLLILWKNKTLTNFADGTFAWWQEGEFYAEQMYEGNAWIRSILTSYFYEGGKYYAWFENSSQMLWMGILLWVVVSLFCSRRWERMKELDVLKLSLIGITVFEMIFEARARYLFIYVPLFILIACTVKTELQTRR